MTNDELKTRLMLPKSKRPGWRSGHCDNICPICGEDFVVRYFVSHLVVDDRMRNVHPKCVHMLNAIKKQFPEVEL